MELLHPSERNNNPKTTIHLMAIYVTNFVVWRSYVRSWHTLHPDVIISFPSSPSNPEPNPEAPKQSSRARDKTEICLYLHSHSSIYQQSIQNAVKKCSWQDGPARDRCGSVASCERCCYRSSEGMFVSLTVTNVVVFLGL